MRPAIVIAVAIVAAATPARAQPSAAPAATVAETPRRDRAVSLGLWSLQGFGGVAGQYEELLPNRRWSWIAGGGIRSAARSDYGSVTLAASGELRYWLRGSAVWADAAPRSMIGWFAGGRLDLAWTRTRDQVDDRTVGNNLAIAVTADFGYRFLIKRRVELSLWGGLGVTRETDLSGRLPGWWRPTPRIGTTLGWMF